MLWLTVKKHDSLAYLLIKCMNFSLQWTEEEISASHTKWFSRLFQFSELSSQLSKPTASELNFSSVDAWISSTTNRTFLVHLEHVPNRTFADLNFRLNGISFSSLKRSGRSALYSVRVTAGFFSVCATPLGPPSSKKAQCSEAWDAGTGEKREVTKRLINSRFGKTSIGVGSRR